MESPANPLSAGADWTNQPFSPFKVDYSFQGSLQPAKLQKGLLVIYEGFALYHDQHLYSRNHETNMYGFPNSHE